MNIEPDMFSQLLEQQKRQGQPSTVAVRSVLDIISQLRGNPRALDMADLKTFIQAAVASCQDLSLLDYARLLRPYSKSVSELAQALYPIAPDAAKLVAALLDVSVYPQTRETEMREVLVSCGYSQNDIDQALRLNYPKTVIVQANRPWQDMDITVGEGEKAVIQYVSGWWFISPQLPRCDANGGPRRIQLPDYALPGYPEGGLVGRINKQAFWVGSHGETPAGLTGQLQLCPNDDLPGSYGVGLADNIGSLTVRVIIKRR